MGERIHEDVLREMLEGIKRALGEPGERLYLERSRRHYRIVEHDPESGALEPVFGEHFLTAGEMQQALYLSHHILAHDERPVWRQRHCDTGADS